MERVCDCYCECDFPLYEWEDTLCALCEVGIHVDAYDANTDYIDFIDLGGEG